MKNLQILTILILLTITISTEQIYTRSTSTAQVRLKTLGTELETAQRAGYTASGQAKSAHATAKSNRASAKTTATSEGYSATGKGRTTANSLGYYADGGTQARAAKTDKEILQADNTSGYTATGKGKAEANDEGYYADGGTQAQEAQNKYIANNDSTDTTTSTTTQSSSTTTPTKPVIGSGQAVSHYASSNDINPQVKINELGTDLQSAQIAGDTPSGYYISAATAIYEADKTQAQTNAANVNDAKTTTEGTYEPDAKAAYGTYGGENALYAHTHTLNDESKVTAAQSQFKNKQGEIAQSVQQADSNNDYYASGTALDDYSVNHGTTAQADKAIAVADKAILTGDGYSKTDDYVPQAQSAYGTYGGKNIGYANTNSGGLNVTAAQAKFGTNQGETAQSVQQAVDGNASGTALGDYNKNQGKYRTQAQTINNAKTTTIGTYEPDAKAAYGTYGGKNIGYANTNSGGSNVTAAQSQFKNKQGEIAQSVQQADSNNDYYASGTALDDYSVNHGTTAQADKAIAVADKAILTGDGYSKTDDYVPQADSAYGTYGGKNIGYANTNSGGSNVTAAQAKFGTNQGETAQSVQQAVDGNASGTALGDYNKNQGKYRTQAQTINNAKTTTIGTYEPDAKAAYGTYGGKNIGYANTNSGGSNVTAAKAMFGMNTGTKAQAIQQADSNNAAYVNGTVLADYSVYHGTQAADKIIEMADGVIID